MKVDIKIISTKTDSSEPCAALICGKKIYLINTPDNVIRLIPMAKVKFINIKHIFLTSVDPKRSSGYNSVCRTTKYPRLEDIGASAPIGYTSQIPFNYIEVIKNDQNFKDDQISVITYELSKSISFKVVFNDVPSTFDVAKAKSLGVKDGPTFGRLARGEDVQLPDGTILQASLFKPPPIPGPRFLIIDCTSLDDLAMLPDDFSDCDVALHFTEAPLLETPEYIRKFSSVHQNYSFSEGSQSPAFKSVRFYDAVATKCSIFDPLPVVDECPSNTPFVSVNSMDEIALIPNTKLVRSPCDQRPSTYPNYLPPPMSVTILGSGCKYPSPVRNPTSHLIATETGFVMLDCAEGTLGQLRTKCGIEGANEILRRLDFLWVSHRHSDHVNGLPMLLTERAKLTDRVLPLMLDPLMRESMEEWIRDNNLGDSLKVAVMERPDYMEIAGCVIRSVDVQHVLDSKGIILDIADKYRIVFSGDRKPNGVLESHVDGCDLLLHEGTFSSLEFQDQTMDKYLTHSSINEAVKAGIDMKARYTVLTHLSMRLDSESLSNENDNVLFSMDFMTLMLDSLDEHVPLLKSAMQEVCTETGFFD